MDRTDSEEEIPVAKRLYACWSIHAFTASGVLCALLGLVAIFNEHPRSALLWLLVAQIIDGVDGPLARGLDVSKYIPVVDGNAMDLIIDYLTCVVVPVIFMLEFELFPVRIELPIAGMILFTAVLWFSRRDIETRDEWFRGFPAGWNLIATSLWLMNFSQTFNAVAAALFIVLTMSNVKFFHILRSPQMRPVTITATTIYMVVMTAMIFSDTNHHAETGKVVILAWFTYFMGMAVWRTMQGDEVISEEEYELAHQRTD